MKKRINLQKKLLSFAEDHGLEVYYQPPISKQITYPCIVYEPIDSTISWGDNVPYLHSVRYQVTLITKNPDPEAFNDLLEYLPYGSFRNKTVTDNLHNFVFYCYE